jgi:hypothetical protein
MMKHRHDEVIKHGTAEILTHQYAFGIDNQDDITTEFDKYQKLITHDELITFYDEIG